MYETLPKGHLFFRGIAYVKAVLTYTLKSTGKLTLYELHAIYNFVLLLLW